MERTEIGRQGRERGDIKRGKVGIKSGKICFIVFLLLSIWLFCIFLPTFVLLFVYLNINKPFIGI